MKKILLICLLISSFCFAQPSINTPSPYIVCETDDSSFGLYDLTSKNAEILGVLNPTLYTVNYYESSLDAENNVNPILNPQNYIGVNAIQYVFVRVYENAVPTSFALTSLLLNLYYAPTIFQSPNMTVYEVPNDNIATFDLTSQTSLLVGNQTGLTITYFLTEFDAASNVNAIANPTAYTNLTNPQTLYTRVESSETGCWSIADFDLIVSTDGIVFIPDANLKAKLIAANTTNTIASNVNPNSSLSWNVYSKIDTNNDGEIQFSEAQAIIYLNVSGSISTNGGIQSLVGLEAFYNLMLFNCGYNQLTTVNLSVFPNLKYFYGTNNNINSINLSNSANLELLNCPYNQLVTVDLSQCVNLNFLVIRNNLLSSLNLDSNDQIEMIYASYNNLSTFQLQDKNFARTIEIGFNQLTNLELDNLPILYRVKAQNNNLSNVDLSGIAYQVEPNNLSNDNVLDIGLNNNVNLTQIILKNGFLNSQVDLMTANLNNTQQFICIDDNDVFTYFSTTPNPVLNSYCSFNPGGDYNTITGTIQYDFNNNSCDATDPSANYLGLEVSVDATTTNSSVYSNGLGVYNLFTSNPGVYGLTPNLENPSIFNVTPSPAEVPVMTIDNSTVTQNFCISANGVHPDLEVVIAPVIPARPGFEAVYKIVYKNKGNQVMTQNYGLNFFYNHNLMNLVSTSVVPSAQGVGGIQWDYANLMPFESRSILVTFLINAPTDATNPVNIDDVLTFTSVVSPQAGDANVVDNTFVYNQTVVGSYDPNDITCLQGNLVVPTLIGEYLHYMIRFENTGTAPAENIVVKTEIDATQYNINSLQMLSASHNATIRRNGNKVEFIFQNIQLYSGGHGNVLLKIKSNDNLVEGDAVSESANIYFDYNFPVLTNDEETVFATLGINEPVVDASISIYPNPVKDIITIRSVSQVQSVQLYDVQGRLLQTMMIDANEYQFNLSERANGVYFVKIATNSGVKIEKIIKE